eukprot:349598-Rhodomonas_salina.1
MELSARTQTAYGAIARARTEKAYGAISYARCSYSYRVRGYISYARARSEIASGERRKLKLMASLQGKLADMLVQ